MVLGVVVCYSICEHMLIVDRKIIVIMYDVIQYVILKNIVTVYNQKLKIVISGLHLCF